MGEIVPIRKQPSPVEEARNYLADMVDVIQGIKVHDENSLTLREIAEENVGLALEILSDYLEDLSKQVKS
ncbi:hypothetical protein [Erwinia aphidicola]|uniref:hypothetical protein n=1 Tax=Erwinia aphidicola TaxID=68334 RepID=UPI0030D2EF27